MERKKSLTFAALSDMTQLGAQIEFSKKTPPVEVSTSRNPGGQYAGKQVEGVS
jgi:hypothetical protein